MSLRMNQALNGAWECDNLVLNKAYLILTGLLRCPDETSGLPRNDRNYL